VIGGNKFGLQRAITINVPDRAPSRVYFRAASGIAVKEVGTNKFALGNEATLQIGKGAIGAPFIRNNELLIPLELKKGENLINLLYTWN
jgi:hypothetical protein